MNSMAPAASNALTVEPTTPSAPAGRTLVVFHLAEASGPSLSLRAELAWLARGGEVEVVVPGPGRVADECSEFAEVTVLDYSALTVATAARVARHVRTFRSHIRRTRPARAVVVTTALPAPLLAARSLGVPVLLYAGEIVPTGPGLARGVAGRLALATARRCSRAVLCCSHTVARQFAPSGPPAFVAYPPIAEGSAGDGPAFRAAHGIPEGAPCVVAAGNIGHARGQDLLVQAAPRLRERFPDLRLVLAGTPHRRGPDARYAGDLRRLAGELGVDGAIVWPGYVERSADLYAAADVVVNPARREAFGRVAAEALLAGRPVVATRVEAVPEVLRDGVDALLVAPEAPAALADAAIRVLENADLRARLVRAGAERVRREFTPARSLEEFSRAVATLDVRG